MLQFRNISPEPDLTPRISCLSFHASHAETSMMAKGESYSIEPMRFQDQDTGVEITRLTDGKWHDHHLYFTESGWWANGRKLVFVSDRNNQTDLYSLDLDTHQATQLTDGGFLGYLTATVSPEARECYFRRNNEVVVLNLETLEERTLARIPEEYVAQWPTPTADGKFLLLGMCKTPKTLTDLPPLCRIYQTHREKWEARPESQVVKISLTDGTMETVWEDHALLGHINPSTRHANLFSFCHEGPWALVDNRIWCMKLDGGDPWKVRARRAEEERIGHEYWCADGETIGYHGTPPRDASERGRARDRIIGFARYDDSEGSDDVFPHTCSPNHIHSLDRDSVVGDGESCLRLWVRGGEHMERARKLCNHHAAPHVQDLHLHPRMTEDGTQVLFTSNARGYGQIYLATLPEDPRSLPFDEEAGETKLPGN